MCCLTADCAITDGRCCCNVVFAAAHEGFGGQWGRVFHGQQQLRCLLVPDVIDFLNALLVRAQSS
jgi:hypothetical protein